MPVYFTNRQRFKSVFSSAKNMFRSVLKRDSKVIPLHCNQPNLIWKEMLYHPREDVALSCRL